MRYSALFAGVFYGIAHKRTLQKAKDEETKHHAVHEREELIKRAKEAWKKQQEGPKDSGEYSSMCLCHFPYPVCDHNSHATTPQTATYLWLNRSFSHTHCSHSCHSHYRSRRPSIRLRKALCEMGKGSIMTSFPYCTFPCRLPHNIDA